MMVQDISDDTEKLYTADYFEKDQGTKNGYTNYLSSPVANLIGKYAFSRLFTLNNGQHLDLGCADGSLMEIFKGEGFTSSGLEISKDAVKIANTKGLDVSFSRLHSFPEGMRKSDIITAFDLLEHADKPGKVLQGVYENLKDGGHFVFSTLSVRNNDPSDYWFNNSLEHYIYYNKENLTFVLTETFGEGNFGFVEMEINGIAEFWGFATKGRAKDEHKIISLIENLSFDKKDAESGYLLSLFYNQVSKFELSMKIIEYFQNIWSPEEYIQAKFYNNFYQGRLEVALKESRENNYLLSATNSVYWQALADAEARLFEIRHQDTLKETADEILGLREELFRVRDELHTLRNSRVLGRIIKTRDKIGNPYVLPKRTINKARRTAAKFVPDSVRLPLMKSLRDARDNVKQRGRNSVVTVPIKNVAWGDAAPLITVVIPYYNRADTIDETLASLAAQMFINFETIIVDDGSTEDASIKKLKKLKTKSTIKVVVLHQKNQGVAAARNTGIGHAKGKYVICLDSDDILEATFIEKATIVLETNPDVALVSTYQDMFGVVNELFEKHPYAPMRLIDDNMVITAAQFRREAWENSGGYKSGIGYEDWEFWLTLAEHGYWGKQIPEPLFKYRTSMQSRYVEDKDVHWNNLKTIRAIHSGYKKRIRSLLVSRGSVRQVATSDTAFINLKRLKDYNTVDNGKANVLITVPWMDFGGVSTLLNNFTREVASNVNLHFITGLPNKNEWEYKFKEITPRVYHMPNLFDEDPALQFEFISNYIETRGIDTLHIVHNGFVYPMLSGLKEQFPKLRIATTVFNDRAPYLRQSVEEQQYIDTFTTDNLSVANIYNKELGDAADVRVIPNGIDSTNIFNPNLFNEAEIRAELKLEPSDIAVFYIGRLSEEKNPDVFVDVAESVIKKGVSSAKFFVIGDGPMRSKIEHAIHHLKSDRIEYLGYQSDIAKYLSAADIFILPSSVEGFPLSIIEAMAMNVAVVATNVGAVADVITTGVNGIVVDEADAAAITSKLEEFIEAPEKLRDIQSQTRREVEKKYSNVILGKNYRKLYKDLNK